MVAAVKRGSQWWSGNPKRRGKPFEVVGFLAQDYFVSRKRAQSGKGDTHVLVKPVTYRGRGAKERFISIDRFIKGGVNGYEPLPEVAK